MKKLCSVLLALLPLAAFAATYPVEVDKSLNGSEIGVTTETIDRDLAGLLLYNYGATPATCTGVFSNGPEPARTRRAQIQPGERIPMTVKFKRDIIRLRVKLTCEPQS